MVRRRVSHGLYGPQRTPPHVPSSPPSVTCNWQQLHSPRCPQQKLATTPTRVRHEALFFLHEEPAYCTRRGHVSGKGSLHLRRKVAQSMSTDPHFPPIYGGFAALRAAVGGSWTSPGMQQPDGKRVVVEAIRPPGPVLPAPVGVSLSLPAGLLKGARPVGLQEQGHLRGCCGRRGSSTCAWAAIGARRRRV